MVEAPRMTRITMAGRLRPQIAGAVMAITLALVVISLTMLMLISLAAPPRRLRQTSIVISKTEPKPTVRFRIMRLLRGECFGEEDLWLGE